MKAPEVHSGEAVRERRTEAEMPKPDGCARYSSARSQTSRDIRGDAAMKNGGNTNTSSVVRSSLLRAAVFVFME